MSKGSVRTRKTLRWKNIKKKQHLLTLFGKRVFVILSQKKCRPAQKRELVFGVSFHANLKWESNRGPSLPDRPLIALSKCALHKYTNCIKLH